MRHAESRFNAGINNEKDSALSENGKKQASSIETCCELVIISNLERTRETLLHSNITYKDRMVTGLCREVKDSICDFLEEEDQKDRETEEQVLKRVEEFKSFLDELSKKYKDIFVITHSGFMYRLLGKKDFIRNCEIITFK